MTIPYRRPNKHLLAILVLLALVAAGVGLWLWGGRQRNPDRIAATADLLFARGQADAALNQYHRAMKYTDNTRARADLLERMAGGLFTLPPQPCEPP